MKNIKFKILFFTIIISFFSVLKTIAYDDCETLADNFDKYQCRVKKICTVYDENKKIFNPEKFKQASKYKDSEENDVLVISGREEKIIKKVVSIYKENMNSIYKCAILGIQKNSILKIKKKLLKLDKTGDIKKSFEPKIDSLMQKINIISNSNKCLNIDKNTIFNKLSILRQTTYLTCDYSFYIEYLKSYYDNPSNALGIDKEEIKKNPQKEYVMEEVGRSISSIKSSLNTEIEHAYKTFPVSYNAYNEYENNFPIHFLLELIKEDYYIFRQKLHKVLNPINQVVYKISNAMKK